MRPPTEKLRIMVEIDLKAPLKKSLERDLSNRLGQAAYDFILARGGDCGDATAKVVEDHERTDA